MSVRRGPKPDAKRARQALAYLGRCETSRKLKWESRPLARRHVRRLIAAGDKRAALLTTYRCDSCDSWHVGHKLPGAAAS